MKIISAEEMATRLDFMSPIDPPEEKRLGIYCIPFEYGDARKGTKISIAKAKEIAAELRAAIAEAEKRELREAFEGERRRNEDLKRQFAETQKALFDRERTIAELRRRPRRRTK